MAKKKYIKDSRGMTVAVTTDTLGLEKPLLNENYDIDVHNRNMDKIDEDLTPIDDSYIIELFQHDGDTTNPKDYYTKVEADEKFASKEDLNNIDLSNLATKEEANNALNKANEAFQRGDEVKTQLVDKLISEGLEVSTNNTFEELIGGIALGKKWASGEKTLSDWTKAPITVQTNLSFKPSIILAIVENSEAGSSCNITNLVISNFNTMATDSLYTTYAIEEVTQTKFKILSTNGYYTYLYGKIKWYAFE